MTTNATHTPQDLARAYSEGYAAGHDDGVDVGRRDADVATSPCQCCDGRCS